MTAGDLVTKDFQLEIRGKLHGPDSGIDTGAGGWTGLGTPGVKASKFDLDGADGSFLGRSFLTSRILTFPLVWHGTSKADVMLELSALVVAWDPRTAVDLRLYAQLPGWGRFYVTGKPMGIAEDMGMLASLEGAGLATFEAGSPVITYVGPVSP